MRRYARAAFVAAVSVSVLASTSCGDGGTVAGPSEEEGVEGLRFAPSVVLINNGGGFGTIFTVSIQVVVTNTSSEPTTRYYPAGCPVRMRLYELGGSGALVYDESQEPCNVATTVSFTLQPGESTILSSTPRFPWDVGGDSLRVGPYDAAGIVRITGENPFELPAGRYDLPRCEVVSPPGALPYTECT